MNSREYRAIIARISRVLIKRHFPEFRRNENELMLFSSELARNVHARMYGANVDGVDSPIWQDVDRINDNRAKPCIEASELLKGE